jgi:hypothetical protein
VIDVQEYETARKLVRFSTCHLLQLTTASIPNGREDETGAEFQFVARNPLPPLTPQVYVFEVAPLNSKTITAYQNSLKVDKSPALNPEGTIPPRMMRLHALYENLTRFVLPLCSAVKVGRPHPETPVSQSNNIVDISGVGLRQFWNLKNHMQDASTVATALYPETLDRIFVSFSSLLRTLLILRSLALQASSRRSGLGSNDGSTRSRCPKYSFSLNKT